MNPLTPPLEAFLVELAQQRGSPHTRDNYRRDLEQFLNYLCRSAEPSAPSGHPPLENWQSLTRKQIRHYLADRHRQGLTPRSLQRHLSSIKRFLNYLQQQSLLETNPADGLRAPKADQLLPKPVDIDHLQGLLDTPPDRADQKSWVQIRDQAILELLYGCGLRLAELIALDLNDLEMHQQQVRVKGKGDKERLSPLGRKAEAAVKRWLAVREQGLKDPQENALFMGRRGQRISRSVVQQQLARAGEAAGIPDRLHPHRLRHSYASHLLESSGDLRGVQELLGHADISSTQIYTRLDYQHLAQVYDRTHPRARRRQTRHKKTQDNEE